MSAVARFEFAEFRGCCCFSEDGGVLQCLPVLTSADAFYGEFLLIITTYSHKHIHVLVVGDWKGGNLGFRLPRIVGGVLVVIVVVVVGLHSCLIGGLRRISI